MIVWNKVTWYSQIFAIVLGVSIFAVGFWIGIQKPESLEIEEPVTSTVESTNGEDNDTYLNDAYRRYCISMAVQENISVDETNLYVTNCVGSYLAKEATCRELGIGIGSVSRECDYELADMIQKTVDLVYAQLTTDLNRVLELDMEENGVYTGSTHHILDYLAEYYRTQYPAIEADCLLQSNSALGGGTATGGYYAVCKQGSLKHMLEILYNVGEEQSDYVENPYSDENFIFLKTLSQSENAPSNEMIAQMTEVRPLPPTKPLSDVTSGIALADAAAKLLPDLAPHYFAQEWYVYDYEQADVTGDDNPDFLLKFFGPYMNHPPHGVVVVSGDKEIFRLHIDDFDDESGNRLYDAVSGTFVEGKLRVYAGNNMFDFVFVDGRFAISND